MSDRANHDALPLIEALLDGTIDDTRFARLESILRDDAETRRLYRSLMNLHAALPGIVGRAPRLSVQIADPQEGSLLEPHEMPHDQLMNLLVQIEEQGEDLDPMELAAKRFPVKPYKHPTKRDWAMAGQYLLDHLITPRRVAYAAAAMVLLAASLFVFFLVGGQEPQADPLAENPIEIAPPRDTRAIEFVATLTDQADAQWRYADLPVELPAGFHFSSLQRLTLTHGFAEITTERGAVALVQAPATIEFTNSDNAIRLHSGKLVGSCQTASSKGFVVHAPGMDVVDLGTEFGVEADVTHGSTVLVMEGSVRAQPTPESPHAFEPVVLKNEQARRIVPTTGGLGIIAASEAPKFYSEKPHSYVTAVLESEPVAYWRFEENRNGTIPNEVSPGRHDLLVRGPASLLSDGVHGGAGTFTRNAEAAGFFLMDGALESFGETGDFTLSCWFWADEVHQGTLLSLFADDQANYKHIALLELQPENDVSTGAGTGWMAQSIRGIHCDPPLRNGAEGTNSYSQRPYKLKAWQHVALVKEQDRVLIYLDGQLVRELPTTDGLSGEARIAIGLTPLDLVQPDTLTDGLRPLLGRIDEVAVYGRALGPEEIEQHWQAANETEDRL